MSPPITTGLCGAPTGGATSKRAPFGAQRSPTAMWLPAVTAVLVLSYPRVTTAASLDPPAPSAIGVVLTPTTFVIPVGGDETGVIHLTSTVTIAGGQTNLRFAVREFKAPNGARLPSTVLVDPSTSQVSSEVPDFAAGVGSLKFALPTRDLTSPGLYTLRLAAVDGAVEKTIDLTFELPAAKLSTGGIAETRVSFTCWPWENPTAATKVRVFEVDGRSNAQGITWSASAPPTSTNGLVATPPGYNGGIVRAGGSATIDIDLGQIPYAGKHTFPLVITSPSAPGAVPLSVVVSVKHWWPCAALIILLGVIVAWACQVIASSVRPALRHMATVDVLQRRWALLRAKASGFESIDELDRAKLQIQAAIQQVRNEDWAEAAKATAEAAKQLDDFEVKKRGKRNELLRRMKDLRAFAGEAEDYLAPNVSQVIRNNVAKLEEILRAGFVDAGSERWDEVAGPARAKLGELYQTLKEKPEEAGRMDAEIRASNYAAAFRIWKATGVKLPEPSASAKEEAAASIPMPSTLSLFDIVDMPAERRQKLDRATAWFVAATTLAVGTLTGLATLYRDQPWGSLWDYFAAFLWGFGANFTVAGFITAYNQVTRKP